MAAFRRDMSEEGRRSSPAITTGNQKAWRVPRVPGLTLTCLTCTLPPISNFATHHTEPLDSVRPPSSCCLTLRSLPSNCARDLPWAQRSQAAASAKRDA
jgi:hypothetical protein